MENKNAINDLMSTTMEKIREMVDVNTVVGDPIEAGGVTILPISQVSVGFASGGSDLDLKGQKEKSNNIFGGGGGASVKVKPVSFLVIKGDTVRLLPVAQPAVGAADRVVEMVPELIDRLTDYLDSRKQDKEKETRVEEENQSL